MPVSISAATLKSFNKAGTVALLSPGDDCHLKFISFHKKGNGSAAKVVEDSADMLNVIKDMYNGTQHPLLANTEADILTGWWRDELWRADVRYAAAVAMVLAGFIDRLNDHFMILSNDNAFLSYYPHFFTQRTLFARFQMNNTLDKHSQLFEKPVYSVMGMLAYLGEQKLRFASTNDDRLKVIATRSRIGGSSLSISIMLIWSTDSMDINTTLITIPVNIFLPNISGKYAVYKLENSEAHPSAVWSEAGCPVYPDSELRSRMRKTQGTHLSTLGSFSRIRSLDLKVQVSMPSITLINICEDGGVNAALYKVIL
ncbi:alpha-L-iduronidase [Nilaparvata lugens]|uniref:alpha-L-iduronidase n=1 Tax=Nilaparvata lugens TaxID=108931 RepID=UPI00193E6BCE|nr:alpha-L-iduronidase [Nilaparvata lugens]